MARTARKAGLHTVGLPGASPGLVQTERGQPGESTAIRRFAYFRLDQTPNGYPKLGTENVHSNPGPDMYCTGTY